MTQARLWLQGEGEVKILSRVLRPWTDVSPDDEHAIMALDSDMVLMALMVPNPNVFVLSEPARYAAVPAVPSAQGCKPDHSTSSLVSHLCPAELASSAQYSAAEAAPMYTPQILRNVTVKNNPC